MLRHSKFLSSDARVLSVRDANVSITDGVKGDKAILHVTYDQRTARRSILPDRFFVKFNVAPLNPMRVLCEVSEVQKCEARFYHEIVASPSWRAAAATAAPDPSTAAGDRAGPPPATAPKCFFVDYNEVSGEFCLLTELVEFGKDEVAPLKHRIRDTLQPDEQRLIVASGAALNARYWLDGSAEQSEKLKDVPRFDETHRRMWWLAQASGLTGLRHTCARTLKGTPHLNEAFMTWRVPEGLIGRERQLALEMPRIMRSLCREETGMLAFGHNDLLLDNVYFLRRSSGSKKGGAAGAAATNTAVGLFDWQQACVNNVGQEWAWNFHFLDPAFLDAHESEMIDLILQTYREHGRVVERDAFLRAYCLGVAQMFVWGGGGLQLLMGRLHQRGLLEGLKPNDPRVRASPSAAGGEQDAQVRELLLGAEMTRRTFTNCCNIMRRHGFVRLWEELRGTTVGR